MSSTTGTRGESVTPANPAFDTVADTTDVTALLERGRALSTPVLRAAVDRLAPPMDTVAAYHFGWIDAQGQPADGDGARPSARPSPCCPRRPQAPRRRPAYPAQWPSNSCTTSRCCTTT